MNNHFSNKNLKDFLEFKYRQYNRPEFIECDPVSVPHQFKKKEDFEVAGFLTATIAWGQRKTIIRNALSMLERMEFEPHDFILNSTAPEKIKFTTFVHRTFNGIDCVYFLTSLQNIYQNHNGLENCFKGNNVKKAILNFRKVFFELPHPARTEKHVANPTAGSSAKRINMFLRWMVRKDKQGVDFGLWNQIRPSELFCPLDVHSGRVARKLGLLSRKQNDWKAVEELTANLRKLDACDPVKYDYALFGLGVFEGF
ncbi:MAG: TIGR02757 family protein [Bacteroidales bacterium]|nr:TIGR02757 family protein [Bacteroidales bacterium]MCF8349590.1 TIGR02757 family protein [Bacteroidales bacterium]MCF8376031.1 TIGR02757 family protein [Bacteroidales bacterium]MCF8400436.1 TIGR02757 family protein [Bacteroidales bacterium]